MTAASTRLVVNPLLSRIFGTADDVVVLEWPATGRRATLSRSAYRLVQQFAVPAAASEVLADLGRSAGAAGGGLEEALASLVEQEILVDVLAGSGVTRQRGLFGAPVVTLSEASRTNADVVVVGVPLDAKVTYRPGARFGPGALRRVSPALLATDADGWSAGALDPRTGSRLLEGMRVVDLGDLATSTASDGGRSMLDMLESTVGVVATSGALPVVLGGDHSLTLRVVDALCGSGGPVGVLHIDAHHDYAEPRQDSREHVHHGNFLGWVVANPHVACVAQLGQRQLTAHAPQADPKLLRWPGESALSCDVDEIVAALPPRLRWHVTIDVDVLDPAVMPSTGTLLPGGWTHREAARLLADLVSRLDVVGVDVVELLPDGGDGPVVSACDLLLRTVHAALQRRTRDA